MKNELNVIFDKVEPTDDGLAITSRTLTAALAQNQNKQLQALSDLAGEPVTEDQISVDVGGRVVIRNAAFAGAVSRLPAKGEGYASNNQYCSNTFCGDLPPPTNPYCGIPNYSCFCE